MALTAYSLFVVRIVRERERNSSIETVKMLLNDFEDQGSDWLFEVDRDRRILGASKHFSDETGLAPENLNGRLFENLFQVGPECAQLVDHLVNRRAFRGLALQLAQEDGKAPRWWCWLMGVPHQLQKLLPARCKTTGAPSFWASEPLVKDRCKPSCRWATVRRSS